MASSRIEHTGRMNGLANGGPGMPRIGLGGTPFIGLVEAVRKLRNGSLSAEELTRECLARIAAHETLVQAWNWIEPQRAIKLAQEVDATRPQNRAGMLAGIPLGIKDVISTVGIPTEMGSPIFAGHIPSESATVIKTLEREGAFVLGKTVTTEFATQHPGKTRNPWNPAHTPGGSSSGSAAAVAAGFVPAALGTQTRGSTIRPAAYCGVVGFKPSYGRISVDGVFPQSHTLDHIGLFARTVADVALLASCCFPLGSQDRSAIDNSEVVLMPQKAPRLVAVRSSTWAQAEESQRANFSDSIRRLQVAGARVETVELPEVFSAGMMAVKTIQLREIADLYAAKLPEWNGQISAAFRRYVEDGSNVTRAQYSEALEMRESLINQLVLFGDGFDGIVTPPAMGEAPYGLSFTGDASFCGIWTLCGVPALSIPSGFGPHGLPLGLQVVGMPGCDYRALQAALWCEQALMSAV